ncbi:ATP-binding protein [Bacillota bacterium LCP21S3_F9]
MSLSKEEYDKLMMEYAGKRDAHRRELSLRKSRVYARIPEYQELDRQIPDLSYAALEEKLSGKEASFSLKERLSSIAAEKARLLKEAGFPADYLQPHYDCPDCRDTGYIDSRKCHCLRQKEIRILYQQSHLDRLLQDNRFDLMSASYYQGTDLGRFKKAVQACRKFLKDFNSDYENLFFYGTVGTGKSFLSICTAGELLKEGHSVLYFSSSSLFDTISSCIFRQDNKAEYHSFLEDLYGCEVLVIDDLGTEMTNNFVAAQLFSLLNERDLRRRATIISTNLSLPELRDRYSDRIFSRITSSYTILKLTGPDIRVARKMRKV